MVYCAPQDDPLQFDADPEVRIIETLRVESGTAPRLSRHLARMAATAARLGYAFNPEEVGAALAALPPGAWRARLELSCHGLTLSHTPLPAPSRMIRLAVAPARLESGNPWLQVKTTRRALYDETRAALPDGVDEMLFLNERDELCEGTITNLFVRIGGRLLTPQLSCGLLPGVMRAELLATGRANEAILHADDLHGAEALFVGNALRGLLPTALVTPG